MTDARPCFPDFGPFAAFREFVETTTVGSLIALGLMLLAVLIMILHSPYHQETVWGKRFIRATWVVAALSGLLLVLRFMFSVEC